MKNSKFIKSAILASLLLLQPVLDPGAFAIARKKTPPKAYGFITEGGKASQGECDGVRKLPRLKRLKEYAKANSYVGSELISSELKSKNNEDVWTHYFRAKEACAKSLASTPSAVKETDKNNNADMPSEDSVVSDEEVEKTEGPDAE